jgi:hypothetical protein
MQTPSQPPVSRYGKLADFLYENDPAGSTINLERTENAAGDASNTLEVTRFDER